jgi:hypothetical protein
MKIKAFLFLSVLLINQAVAQNNKFKWGDVSPEELESKFCQFEPSAEAEVLFNIGNYYFDTHYYMSAEEVRTIYQYQSRIKIYDKRGLKHATFTIYYKGYDSYEDIAEIKGITYNLDATGKVVKTKLKWKSIEWKKEGKDLWHCTFTLPEVKPGSVIDVSYKIASLDFLQLRDFVFQRNIPCKWSEINLTTPNFFNFALVSTALGMATNEKADAYLNWRFYNRSFSTNATKIKIALENIPTFRKEPLMPDSAQVIKKASFYLVSAQTKPIEFINIRDYYWQRFIGPLLLTTTEGGTPQSRMMIYNSLISGYKIVRGEDYKDLIKRVEKMEEFGQRMRKFWNNQTLADSFKKIQDRDSRVKAIYNYVSQNYTWNGQYSAFAPRPLEEVSASKSGNSAEINMILLSLLNRSEIKAAPVLIATKDFGKPSKEFGLLSRFNHLLVMTEYGNTNPLLDAIEPLLPFGILPVNDLNGEGLLIQNNTFEWVKLENIFSNSENNTESCVLKGNRLNINLHTQNFGYQAADKRYNLGKLSQQDWLNLYYPSIASGKHDTLILRGATNKELQFENNITLQTGYEPGLDGKITLQPLMLNEIAMNTTTRHQRVFPFDFGYNNLIKRVIKVTIPDGYALSDYPKDANLTMPGNGLSYQLKSSIADNNLIIETSFAINQTYFEPQFAPEISLFFERMMKKNLEAVVFKKL